MGMKSLCTTASQYFTCLPNDYLQAASLRKPLVFRGLVAKAGQKSGA
jgi:hypothetical protein